MNKRISATFLAMLLGSASAQAADVAGDAQRIFLKASPSVVTIKTLDDQGAAEALGSGVVVGNGLVATNCHVIAEAASIRILAAAGEHEGKWIKQVDGQDLCLLSAAGLKAVPVKLRPSHSLTVGEPVYAIGNPLGFGLAVSSGLIGVIDKKDPYPLIVATTPLSHGSSGGGIFDGRGQLVGISTATLGTGQNLNKVLASDGVGRLIAEGSPRPSQPLLPPPEKSWHEDAVPLQRSSRWVELEKYARAWHQAQPNAALALVFLGMAQSEQKQYADAEATLQRALALDKDMPFAWLSLAYTYLAQEKSEKVEQALKEVETRFVNHPGPQTLRAFQLRKQGKLREALVQAREGVRKAPGNSAAWVEVGQIEDALGNRAEASHALAVALRLGTSNAEAKRRLAELYAQSGKTAEAARTGLLKDFSVEQEGAAQLAIGMAELKAGRVGPAEAAIRKAIALSPRSSDAWNTLGNLLVWNNRMAEAEDAYDKAIELSPSDPNLLSNRAVVRIDRKKRDLALQDIRRALELSPDNAAAWRADARAKLDAREYREANLAFEKLERLSPLTPDELVSWAESLVGTRNLDEALKLARQAEAQDPKSVRMGLTMAKILGLKGDLDGTHAYLDRVLARDPVNVNAWSSKGYVLMKQGRLPEAIEALETAVRLDPELVNAWINLGEAQMRQRNLGRAIQVLERAIVLAPTAVDARLFLAQSYMGARLPAKAREQVVTILEKRPNFAPALGVLTITYLMEGNTQSAIATYLKMKAAEPSAASAMRQRVIASGLVAANSLPE